MPLGQNLQLLPPSSGALSAMKQASFKVDMTTPSKITLYTPRTKFIALFRKLCGPVKATAAVLFDKWTLFNKILSQNSDQKYLGENMLGGLAAL